jgi:hypothetical protein
MRVKRQLAIACYRNISGCTSSWHDIFASMAVSIGILHSNESMDEGVSMSLACSLAAARPFSSEEMGGAEAILVLVSFVKC